MVDSPLITKRNWQLSGAALAFPDKETAVDEGGEQVLCGTAWHGSMVPAMLLQTVDWRDVVGGHPTLAVLWAHFTPLSILVVAQHTQFLTWTQRGQLVRFGLMVIQSVSRRFIQLNDPLMLYYYISDADWRILFIQLSLKFLKETKHRMKLPIRSEG